MVDRASRRTNYSAQVGQISLGGQALEMSTAKQFQVLGSSMGIYHQTRSGFIMALHL